MDESRLAARLADIDAMEARVNGAPDKDEAIIEEMIRLLDERDEARAALATVTAERDRLRTDMREALGAAEMLATVERTQAIIERANIERERDEALAALDAARREGAEGMRERAANACERMVVGGCAWSEEQAAAGRALLDAAGNIRALPLDAPTAEAPRG